MNIKITKTQETGEKKTPQVEKITEHSREIYHSDSVRFIKLRNLLEFIIE